MARHGVQLPGGSFERAFDEGMAPATPVTPGSFATPLAMLSSTTGTIALPPRMPLASWPAAPAGPRLRRS